MPVVHGRRDRCGGAAISLHQRQLAVPGILGTPQRADLYKRPGLAMKEGIKMVSLQDMRIFELTNGRLDAGAVQRDD